jgi:hypothetical protein
MKAATLLAALALAGCYRLAARTGPAEGSIEVMLRRGYADAARAALQALNAEGIGIEQFRPDSGLVESVWYDIAQLEPAARDYPADERTVRFRFIAVPDTARGTRMWVETLQASTIDPLGSRRRERPVPGDHPALRVARRLIEQVELRLSER